MTLTEAAACGTPAVATAIAGHADAVLDGESGLLVRGHGRPGGGHRPGVGGPGAPQPPVEGRAGRARWFTWDATARRALEALAEEATQTPGELSVRRVGGGSSAPALHCGGSEARRGLRVSAIGSGTRSSSDPERSHVLPSPPQRGVRIRRFSCSD